MELEDIKVGKYIRTESGNIEKVRTINFVRYTSYTAKSRGKEELCGYYRPLINGRYELEDIQDCKDFLIELIKVGDFINGECVDDITKNYVRVKNMTYGKQVLKSIKTIATKEHFRKIQQKVGE